MSANDAKTPKIRPNGRSTISPLGAVKLVLLGLVELWFPRYWFSTTSRSSRRAVIGLTLLVGAVLSAIALSGGDSSAAFGMVLGFGLLAAVLVFMHRRSESKNRNR